MEEQGNSKITFEEMPLNLIKEGNTKINQEENNNKKTKKIRNFIYISIVLFLVLANFFQIFFFLFKINKNNNKTKKIELHLNYSLEREIELEEKIYSINISLIEAKKKARILNRYFEKEEKDQTTENNETNKKILKYFTDCENGILYDNNIEHFKKKEKPKISVIIPGYNVEKYITRALRSVQNQSMKDIEIIFVDDCSSDNTNKIVKNHMKEDHRIVLIKNEENLGLFRTRIKGISFSNGEFIQNLDSDDLLIGNILEISYQAATDLNIDIVEFVLAEGVNNELKIRNRKIKDKIYVQPELGDLMWYGRTSLLQTNYNIYTKLIKKETMLNTFKFIGDEFINKRINLFEDNLLDFAVLRSGHFFKFIDDYGYYYWRGGGNTIMDSLMTIDKPEKANDVVKSILTVAKFYYMKTKNNYYDKAIAYAFVINHIYWGDISAKIMTKGFELMNEVFDLYLSSPYFDYAQKKTLQNKFINFQSL